MELGAVFVHFLMLSTLSFGGAITVAPEMHRYMVGNGWIDDAQFSASIAIAQSSPGPNILFVTLIGFTAAGAAGAVATTLGMLVPSSIIAVATFRWTEQHRERALIRAFRAGMAPVTIGLVAATGWILAQVNLAAPTLVAVTAASALVLIRTRINPLWTIAAGAVVGVAAQQLQ
ncbi:MAG: chromate transporter [Burkholderiaceae bacterium]|nr:chromate transporter [Burkholderiaceae bacterium]